MAKGAFATSCDLLSFYYLCRTRNNATRSAASQHEVVICFHFTIFVVLGTTRRHSFLQPHRCDLLSFYYLCRTRNNSTRIIRCMTVNYRGY